MPETLAPPRISKKSLEHLEKIRYQLHDEREPYKQFWQKYGPRVNPIFYNWDEDTEPGTEGPPDKKDQYDNTAQKASDILANGIQSNGFGRQVPWIQLATEDAELQKDRGTQEWLQLASRSLARQFSRTNFYDEARPFTKSAADFGTGIIFREHNKERGIPVYHALHLKRCLIAEDGYGEVDTLIRDFWLAAWEAVGLFGEKNLPKTIQDDYRENNPKKRKYRQYIFPRDKFDLDLGARTNGKRYYSLFIADCEPQKPIAEGGYEERPFYVWRWGRSLDGVPWGVDSPGMIEYSNVLQLNAEKKDFTRLVQLAAQPMFKATAGLEGKIQRKPASTVFLKPGQDFVPVPMVGDLAGISADMEIIRKSINETYQVQFFLALQANIERLKTATEVAGIKGEQAAMLAAMTGRLHFEFLEPATEDLFSLELMYGRLPPVPENLKGQRIRIDLVSPLAQLQKRYMMLNETDEFMIRVLQVAQQAPEVLDKVDLDAYADTIAEAYNQDRRVVRDLADVENMRKRRAQQQEAMAVEQMRNERMKAQASMLQAGGKSPEPGSPVEKMMGGGEA